MSQPKEIDELKVYRGKSYAGILQRTQQGCQFTFAPEFLNDSSYSGLCFYMPKQKTPYKQSGVNLFPFFAGLLPEGLRFKALVKNLKTSEDDIFSLLVAVGQNCVGDVFVRLDETESIDISVLKASEIDFYKFFLKSLEAGALTLNNESLAGVQEKISASMISFPVNVAKKSKLYILKLNPKDKPNLIQNEYNCLKLAKKCGLQVNSAKFVKDKNKNLGLLVERFDRLADGVDGSTQIMVHQEDACQFMNRFPADKYRVSFREIAEEIQKVSTAPQIDCLRLIQIYAFSYLIGNGDLHAKNVSLQVDPETGRVQLTPFYDLICTYIYKDRKMALKIEGRDDNIKRRDLIQFGNRMRVPSKPIHSMLDKMLRKLDLYKELLLSIEGLRLSDKNLLMDMLKKRMRDLQK